MFDNAVDATRAHPRQRFEVLARSLRDVLAALDPDHRLSNTG
jgi:hypothetical protein